MTFKVKVFIMCVYVCMCVRGCVCIIMTAWLEGSSENPVWHKWIPKEEIKAVSRKGGF